ncbi:hypothetical protein [Lapidilactobacillus luobeiensis]|uniref:hypothetical protein n=1 Tax=Lapidilactobacillus luobeiensis TaxID=2950371 RepID=UPI0021C264F3|nr:hypothetical protein [Lapidilactobacillus luobeiensis]
MATKGHYELSRALMANFISASFDLFKEIECELLKNLSSSDLVEIYGVARQRAAILLAMTSTERDNHDAAKIAHFGLKEKKPAR